MTQKTALPLRATVLDALGLTHGFFTRLGGVSTGVYASLNGGVGSQDDPRSVAENRRRMAVHLGVDPADFLVPYQIHSSKALIVTQAFVERPHCDSLATSVRGLGLGVTGADCGMILFADRGARVIAAAHAGWKGALGGVLEATLEAMETLGARRASTVAALGPTISRNSYEVDTEFADRFIAASTGHASFFRLRRAMGISCSICQALSRRGCGLRASAYLRIWPATPMPSPRSFIPIAARCIETIPTTAARSRRSRFSTHFRPPLFQRSSPAPSWVPPARPPIRYGREFARPSSRGSGVPVAHNRKRACRKARSSPRRR